MPDDDHIGTGPIDGSTGGVHLTILTHPGLAHSGAARAVALYSSAMSVVPHHRVRMTGRDPDEKHRVASTLELLFDLTFVIAFGTAAGELAHSRAAGHIAVGVGGFAFAGFGVFWAWLQ